MNNVIQLHRQPKVRHTHIEFPAPREQEPFDSMLWFKSVVIFWLVLLVGVSLVWVTHS